MGASETPVQDDTAASVRAALELLTGVVKRHAFYPEGNAALQQSLMVFHDRLRSLLEREGCLRLDVLKSQLAYRGEVVLQEQGGERTLIFPLFRDGVQWIEFQEGIPPDEVEVFIRIVNDYRELSDESENDLVTALWEADLQHIRHKAVDKFWEAETLVDISTLKASGAPGGDGEASAMRPGTGAGAGSGRGGWSAGAGSGGQRAAPHSEGAGAPPRTSGEIHDPAVRVFMSKLETAQAAPGDPRFAPGGDDSTFDEYQPEDIGEFWKLTPGEESILRELIASEEHRNNTKDCLDVLLALANETLDLSDRALVGEFVTEGIHHILSQGDFDYVRAFVEKLASARESGRPGASRFADEMAGRIADVGVLGALNQVWPRARAIPDAALVALRDLFFMLPSAVIASLAPMLSRSGDARVKAILLNAIAYHAGRVRTDILHIIAAIPAGSICELIGTYTARGLTPPEALLAKLTRHQDSSVRATAARALVADSAENLKTVSHLLDDPDRNVARWLLELLGRERNPVAERLLLDYLAGAPARNGGRDEKHILECYRALGQCASKAGVDFLRGVLMKKNWRTLFGLEHNFHRTGAAIALSLMPAASGAAEVLRDAENSRFLGIRRAYAQAVPAMRKKARNDHE